jgi:hypothetical protein
MQQLSFLCAGNRTKKQSARKQKPAGAFIYVFLKFPADCLLSVLNKGAVDALLLHKLTVFSLLDYLSAVYNDDAVGVLDCF